MDSRLDWNLYASFREVMRQGSLSAAARTLGLTQPTLGRHVAALEAGLGTALFTRSPQGLIPTAAALELLPRAEEMHAAAEAAARAISGGPSGETGVVRITASEIIGGVVLPPILAAFRALHPAVVIELVLTNRNEDLLRRDADIAVRMVRPVQSALVARRIGSVGIGLYAHRRYAQAHGLPATLDDLAAHPVIGFDRDDTARRSVAAEGPMVSREAFAFRCDSDLAQLAALRAGFGIGGCQAGIAADEPDLVPVLPDAIRFELEMWLAMHEDLRAVVRVRLMFEHLAASLGQYARRR
ncbi:MAG: LysR family transcriptional regulator [Caulobacter sp.]|nr:LysR family transcriptional regulator [Caulobacter sp.]